MAPDQNSADETNTIPAHTLSRRFELSPLMAGTAHAAMVVAGIGAVNSILHTDSPVPVSVAMAVAVTAFVGAHAVTSLKTWDSLKDGAKVAKKLLDRRHDRPQVDPPSQTMIHPENLAVFQTNTWRRGAKKLLRDAHASFKNGRLQGIDPKLLKTVLIKGGAMAGLYAAQVYYSDTLSYAAQHVGSHVAHAGFVVPMLKFAAASSVGTLLTQTLSAGVAGATRGSQIVSLVARTALALLNGAGLAAEKADRMIEAIAPAVEVGEELKLSGVGVLAKATAEAPAAMLGKLWQADLRPEKAASEAVTAAAEPSPQPVEQARRRPRPG
jgi:hypothetical protein